MITKNTGVGLNRGIYDSPYDASANYMNVLSDFIKYVNSLYPEDIDNEELNPLLATIRNRGEEIAELRREADKLETRAAKATKAKTESKVTVPKKATTKRPVTKKVAAEKED